ncbi:hypothetical protein [Gorillibacterium massiliense]|uniref:hypothetical protein n=1 Tax=Gorillibacterium massiliense TaxID=1280390 RepID=UPI0004B3CB8E|nr:hypothetical protein [Gorillibacterium massiliense]
MKKKLWIGITALVLVMGIGTSAVFAAATDTDPNNAKGFFEQMLPFARQMHPNLTDKQIQNMYNRCQGSKVAGVRQMMNFSDTQTQ